MILRPLTDGKVSGTGFCEISNSSLGGVLISTDGTNAAVVIIRNSSENYETTGSAVFDISSKQPGMVSAPIRCNKIVYYSISGTGASAQLYEWIE